MVIVREQVEIVILKDMVAAVVVLAVLVKVAQMVQMVEMVEHSQNFLVQHWHLLFLQQMYQQ